MHFCEDRHDRQHPPFPASPALHLAVVDESAHRLGRDGLECLVQPLMFPVYFRYLSPRLLTLPDPTAEALLRIICKLDGNEVV